MAPVRNISRVLFAVVTTGMLGLLAGAFSYHQVKAQSASVKLKKDGNAPHIQKKVVFKRRLTLDGGWVSAATIHIATVAGTRYTETFTAPIAVSFFHPSLRGPPTTV